MPFLHSSFLQAISAVMLWPVHVQKVSQASEHLCPAKLQTRCDICRVIVQAAVLAVKTPIEVHQLIGEWFQPIK